MEDKIKDTTNNNEHTHHHGHNHDHSNEKNMKSKAILLSISAVLLLIAYWLYSTNRYTVLAIILFAASYLIAGSSTLIESIRNIFKGQIFDENFLVSLAPVGALLIKENASNKKTDTENFITTFARYYTPAVVITASVLAVVPPLIIPTATFKDWIYRALTFLVISCPCALVLSIPLTFFAGIGGASKCGVLVKGSNYLESLAKTEIVVFDKTGTLTKGVFKLAEINLNNKSPKKKLAFVGDGINDAPVLARADIGIAMGGVGSDATIEAADVVIMTDQPSRIPTAIGVSRKTLRIATQNIYFSIIVKILVLILGAFGYASMWEAVFADVGVSIIAVLNAVRCMNVKKYLS